MNRNFFSQTGVAVVPAWLVVLILNGAVQAQPKYSYTTLDFPGTAFFQLTSINSAGQTVGFYDDSTFFRHGFFLKSGTKCNPGAINCPIIDPPGSFGTTVTGINSAGQIVGHYEAFGSPSERGFLFSKGTGRSRLFRSC